MQFITKNLQLYLSLRMKLTKIYRILKFKQFDWMKKYIDFDTEKRMDATNDFEKDFLKLMINSAYGKCMIFIIILLKKNLMLNCYLQTQRVLLMKYENVYEEFFKWKDLFDLD